MAIPFPRSTRSLAIDSFRYTLIGLAVAALLLVAWLGWFFGATITFTASSDTAQLTDDEVIVAEFPKEQLHRILRGQRARFYPDGEAGSVAVIVNEINREPQSEQGQVTLLAVTDRRSSVPPALPAPTSGRVEIEIEYLSPLRLLMRNIGLLDSAPSAPVKSPRDA